MEAHKLEFVRPSRNKLEEFTGTRKVLFIVMPYLVQIKGVKSRSTRSILAFPYGVLSMATYLKRQVGERVNVEVLDCNLQYDQDHLEVIRKKLEEFRPDIVGLSMMFDNSYKFLRSISQAIKEFNKDTVLVLGGAAATTAHQEILTEHEEVDAICFYEGEVPILKLVNSTIMPDFLENDISWVTKKSLNQGKIPAKTNIANLDDVIGIDYRFVGVTGYEMMEAFSPGSCKVDPKRQFFLVTSRGCPYMCVFCEKTADLDKSMRYASVDKIIEHVRFLVNEYGMNVLTMYDDQLLMNKKRAKQLFRELAQFNLRIECPNGLTVAFMDEEMIELMKKAGMDLVCLAIEHGSSYVLNKIIHKPLNLRQVAPVVSHCHKYGIFVEAYIVVGLPGEEEEHREETIRFIKEVGIDWVSFNLATPLRGTALYKLCLERGYIDKKFELGDLGMHDYIIRIPGIDPAYIRRRRYMMNLDVNFVNNRRMRVGDYRIAQFCFEDVIERYENHAFAYYYLANALSAQGKRSEAQKATNEYYRIVQEDKTWKGYAEHFGLV